MKTFGTIFKIIAALAAIAGVVYVVATYGDKIVSWAKKLLGKVSCCGCCEDIVEVPTEEAAAEEETPAEEAAAESCTVQAEETDFEG